MEFVNNDRVAVFRSDWFEQPSMEQEREGAMLWKLFNSKHPAGIERFEKASHFYNNSTGIPNIAGNAEIHPDEWKIGRKFIEGETLSEYLHKLDITSSIKVLHDVASALKIIHERRMIYSDIKPPNVILGDDSFNYLIDFDGIVNVTSDRGFELGIGRGTHPYLAPERLMGEHAFCTYASDTFGLGMMAYFMLDGGEPYDLPMWTEEKLNIREIDEWERQTTEEILNKDARRIKSGSRDLNALVKDCVNRDYSKRPGDEELVERLAQLRTKYCKE